MKIKVILKQIFVLILKQGTRADEMMDDDISVVAVTIWRSAETYSEEMR